MKVVKVIESKCWRNTRTGATASLYGAVPWVRREDEAEWTVVARGWTWEMSNGTIGLGRVPAASREEAEEIMRRVNAR